MNSHIQEIASRMLLCTLETHAWRATKLHKKETQSLRAEHNSDAPKVSVTVCSHQALTDLASLHARAYAVHKALTFPTVQDGMRFVSPAGQMKHCDTMREFADESSRITAIFLADYDAEKSNAPYKLNGLYDASMWPNHDIVARKFGFQTRYMPCPVDGAWGDWLTESAQAANSEMKDRLREALERVRERCQSDRKLHATVFSSLADLLALVPDMDITGELSAVAQAASELATLSADTVSADNGARAQAASRASNILTLLGGIK